MGRYPKRKKKAAKTLRRYCRHIGYRIQHYGELILRCPGRICEYILGLLCYRRSPWYGMTSYDDFAREHGRYGEFQLWRKANRYMPKNTVWFANLYLPKKDETTCEIDLLAVSTRGIFVFESKNYIGRIFGDEKNPYWYQLFRHDPRKNFQKFSFFNPIMQNAMHCRWLKNTLNMPDLPIYSFVVFGNRCRLQRIKCSTENTVLCNQRSMRKYIRKYCPKTLTADRVQTIAEKLKPYTDINYFQKIQHIRAIESKKQR